MHRIEIINFGPVNNLNLDIKDFMLFIGPQASGKSTIAKAVFFFKSLTDDMVKYLTDAIDNNNFSQPTGSYAKLIRQKFADYFGASAQPHSLHLKYFYTDAVWIAVTLEENHSYVTPEFSKDFESFFKKLVKESETFSESLNRNNVSLLTSKDLIRNENEKQKFISYVKNKCAAFFDEDRELIFIPAGRSLLATLADQLQYVNPRKLDYLMRSFVDRINLLKPIFNRSLDEIVKEKKLLTRLEIDYDKTNLAKEIIRKILKGKYQYDKDGEKIFYDSEHYVKLNFSSSGQQESLWILLLIFIAIVEQQNVFIVIEEPEAHLFPEAQKEIAALIALLSNMKQSQVIVTTHSPYILAAINNLMLAGKVGSVHRDEISQKINSHLWINREKVYAAMVQSGATSDIIDDELNIIQQEHIDAVSSQINEEFDFLYRYESAGSEQM